MSDFNKITSTFNLSGVGSEQLFTELTPEQADVIEGGATYYLHLSSIECITETPGLGSDEAYLTVNGQRVWGSDMDTGDYATINRGLEFQDLATISLYEDDSPWSSPDHMGTFTVAGPTNGLRVHDLEGSGARYRLTYRVFG